MSGGGCLWCWLALVGEEEVNKIENQKRGLESRLQPTRYKAFGFHIPERARIDGPSVNQNVTNVNASKS